MADKIADQVKILWQNKSLDELQAIVNKTDPSIWSTEAEVQAAREIIIERTNKVESQATKEIIIEETDNVEVRSTSNTILESAYEADPKVHTGKVSCRVCGKEIFESAISCSSCGSAQGASVQEKLNGVKGWLLLFCLGIGVLSPIFYLINIGMWSEVDSNYSRAIEALKWYDILSSAFLAVFGIIIAVLLCKRLPNAIKMAKRFIIIVVLIDIVSFILVLSLDLPSNSDKELYEFYGGFIRTLIWGWIWYSYFIKSKRVKATYIS